MNTWSLLLNVGHTPCFYHLQKCTDRVEPRHNVSFTSMCIRYCDCRPWEGKKVLEGRKEVSPRSTEPARGKWQIGWPALIYIILYNIVYRSARTMGCCGLGNIQYMQNKPDSEHRHWLAVGIGKGNTECKSYSQPLGSTRVKSVISRLGESWLWLWSEDELWAAKERVL